MTIQGSIPEVADPVIHVSELRKTFHTLDAEVIAADGIDLAVGRGTVTALTGPSGSGKSTLLHLIGALDSPDSGTIRVGDVTITEISARRLADYRASIGFVFQSFHLLATLSVLDNVTVPLLPRRGGRRDAARTRDKARELLAAVGLAGRENSPATKLSGGQQQRVAIARALINEPSVVLADEPTGNLDTHTGEEIIRLLFDLRDTYRTTLVIATHDFDLAKRCDNVVHLRDGRLTTEAPQV
ncbi:ABC transporter ATP-binding protein [Nocardioides terrisoli]|uniref:ABC transporter ATP-binding protein n=1 Tax=Nocardioides terrisoli TaxID=3388267 RepID=UPI00287BA320|nr:ABC transporter ATP-binding protein [Nocardioides marmorisolisilvae]